MSKSKKNVSGLVSSLGMLMSIFTKLFEKMRNAGLGDEDLHRLATPEGDILLDKFVELMAKAKSPKASEGVTFTPYILTIDPGLSPEAIVAQGKFDWAHDEFRSDRPPFKVRSGGERELVLVCFNRDVADSDVDSESELLRELDRLGLQPEGLPELCAFGAKHPDLQREFPIAARRAAWRSASGNIVCPIVNWHDSDRTLAVNLVRNCWHRNCRFLASSK